MEKRLSYHYYNSHSLLVINRTGVIKIVYTPFRALLITETEDFPANTWLYVEEVLSTAQDQLQYMVQGRLIPYKLFRLVINF